MSSIRLYLDRATALAWGALQLFRRADRKTLLKAAWRVLAREGPSGILSAVIHFRACQHGYDYWLARFGQLGTTDRAAILGCIEKMRYRPVISVICPTYDPPPELLERAINSVRRQLYPHWELCIADDASQARAIRDLIEHHAQDDARIRYVFRGENGHISAATNSAIELASGEFLAFLDHDDELAAHALFMVANRLNSDPDLDMLYGDEDKIAADGSRSDPYFKPDWNPDLLTGQNYVCHLAVYRAALVRELGGMRAGYEGAQDWDLALRVADRIPARRIAHIPDILYHWRTTAASTASGAAAKPYAREAGRRAVQDHLARCGRRCEVVDNGHGYFRLRPAAEGPLPKTTILIPTRNGHALIKRCIDSIQQRTRHAPYELLVIDNGSDDPSTLRYLQQLEANGSARVVRDDRPFNFSALNNRGAALARGEVLCLLNNDTEVIAEDWLAEMVSLAIRPETGAVGAMLYYPDDTIQHAGTLVGLGGVAGHLYLAAPRNTGGYMGRACLTQNVSAVTAACLVVRKSVFLEVGGLDEHHLAVAFNDVDLCLKIQERGYRNAWTPFAELYHHESASRGLEDTPAKMARFRQEAEYMKRRWGSILEHDPAHNPNLALDAPWPTPTSMRRVRPPWC